MFKTPILFLIFNRPDTSKKVFEAIKQIRPSDLFIAADGPRSNHVNDATLCKQVREEVMSSIDWKCNVHTLFRDENVGCGRAVEQAITWFFEHVGQGIILEDDVLPDKTFFYFCEEMLEYYKDNTKVMQISGNNFLDRSYSNKKSYFFSKYIHIWGWATWRRAWKCNDYELKSIDKAAFEKLVREVGLTEDERKFWEEIYHSTRVPNPSAWDYQWLFSIWKNKGVSITPASNLVSNIGFGENATHTFDPEHKLAGFPTVPITFPLVHNEKMRINKTADSIVSREVYNIRKVESKSVLTILNNRVFKKLKL
jgi:hypothetical protein